MACSSFTKRWYSHDTAVSWEKSIKGMNHGSVLRQLSFTMNLNDLFYHPGRDYLTYLTEVCNFEDNAKFYGCDKNVNPLFIRLNYEI